MIRKFIFLIAVGLFIGTGLISLSFAQGMNEKMGNKSMMGKDMMESDMMANGEMMKKCSMHGMMMKGMAEKSMIATADGGVIVLAGNKLIKYDKDLNFVKEVEIKIDMEAMQKMMMQQQGGMMEEVGDPQVKLKCAERWLKKAIKLHELHMRDSRSTTEASQMELMDQIKKAYECVTGMAVR